MTPKNEALAFRIWQYCNPIGWNCTTREIADALDVHNGWVTLVISAKKWQNRLRVSNRRVDHYNKNAGTIGLESFTAKREIEAEFQRDGVIR